MTERESLVAAVAAEPGDDGVRLVLADWLEDHGEAARAEYVRASCAAARARRGSQRRAELLDRAGKLLARNEAGWLGEWRDRLVDWGFRRGFLHRVRLTAKQFLRHGDELFRREPVGTVELVEDDGEPLGEDAIHAVVEHPAFAFVRDCAVPGFSTPLNTWLKALAKNAHVTGLRRLGPALPGGEGDNEWVKFDRLPIAAFCQAAHLRNLRSLDLGCQDEYSRAGRPWLISSLASASFAGSLRSLRLVGCGLPSRSIREFAVADFPNLRRVDLSFNSNDRGAWSAVFESKTLAAVRSIAVGAEMLPDYACSAMAKRVRDLTVRGADDLERDRSPDRAAWLAMIERAPPPRRLELNMHQPGRAVFAAMRRSGWLRKLRELSIRSDSQYELYSGRDTGLRYLFGPKSMPRLARLRLHEVRDGSAMDALAGWPGLAHLEALELTNDYFGGLFLGSFKPAHAPRHLRTLRGAVAVADADLKRFRSAFPLERLTRLSLSFVARYDHGSRRHVPQVSPASAESLVRSAKLSRLTELQLAVEQLPDVSRELARALADPMVMARLRRLRFFSGGRRPALAGLRARFGPRLQA